MTPREWSQIPPSSSPITPTSASPSAFEFDFNFSPSTSVASSSFPPQRIQTHPLLLQQSSSLPTFPPHLATFDCLGLMDMDLSTTQDMSQWYETFGGINAEGHAAIVQSPPDDGPGSPPKSAQAIYGIPQCEIYRFAIKALPSFQGGRDVRFVDMMFDLFLAQTRCTNVREVQRHAIKILYARTHILDSCINAVDRLQALELIEDFKSVNREHVALMYSVYGTTNSVLSAIPPPPPGKRERGDSGFAELVPTEEEFDRRCSMSSDSSTSAITESYARISWSDTPLSTPSQVPDLTTLKTAMNLVPSLHPHPHKIAELCTLFESQAACANRETRLALIFKFIKVRSEISELCASSHDRNKFQIAMEIGREHNRGLVEEMYLFADKMMQV
ncbi:hypothetical protein HDU98_004028 [Podochytrium sp. JEL0797]|nr:hypothetical protein HDU98_004028 [Podochytrium sp. JEL0797]